MDSEEYDSDDWNQGGYEAGPDGDVDDIDPEKVDPEYFDFYCLNVEAAEKLLNESVEKLSNGAQITPSLAKALLHTHKWAVDDIISEYKEDPSKLLVTSKIKPPQPSKTSSRRRKLICPVCVGSQNSDEFRNLACGHQFCKDCWSQHFEVQIREGVSTSIGCMAKDCEVLALEDFVLNLLTRPSTRNKYQEYVFRDYVKTHPQLRYCPGPNCAVIIRASELKAKRVFCEQCKTNFCFLCGMDYHAPTDCATIKKWLTKCADDSETANYICAHTKDCPKCHVCIEKNGGCNHMKCYSCKYDFCWLCLGDWKAHGSGNYECSRYRENPNVGNESVQAQAREALKKYLHYYERWENHSKSLKLEKQTEEKIKARIDSKVMTCNGTWIDWQYLLTGASLLTRCRYTLQYTYPYAYYMEAGSRKNIFEYQQAQLEAEIENLSWKIEHSETTDQGDLINQMDIADKKRVTLLKDFLEV